MKTLTKKVPLIWKKMPWLCPTFHCNVFLRASRRKNSNMFSWGCSFHVFLMKCLSKCPSSTKSSLSRKISCCTPALRHYSFCKTLHLKFLTVFGIRLCLNNCSVICTVTYAMHCIRHIKSSGILKLCLFRYMLVYSVIFSIINTCSHILSHY